MPLGPALRRREVDLLLLAVAAVWGSSYLASKVLVETAGVGAVLALRFGVATLVLAAVAATDRRPWTRHETLVGVVLGLTQGAVLALETAGVGLTSATNAGLLISVTVVLTPLLDGLWSRRWLPRAFFVAAVLTVVGIALLVTEGGFRTPTAGDALVLAAALVRALHVTALGRLTAGRGHGTVRLTLLQSAVCVVVFAAADVPGLTAAVQGFEPRQWAVVAYLGLACSVFAFLVQLWAVRRTSPARAGLLMGTEPLWALLIGLTIGGEALGPAGAAGAALLVAATWWGQRIETRHRMGPVPAPPTGLSRPPAGTGWRGGRGRRRTPAAAPP